MAANPFPRRTFVIPGEAGQADRTINMIEIDDALLKRRTLPSSMQPPPTRLRAHPPYGQNFSTPRGVHTTRRSARGRNSNGDEPGHIMLQVHDHRLLQSHPQTHTKQSPSQSLGHQHSSSDRSPARTDILAEIFASSKSAWTQHICFQQRTRSHNTRRWKQVWLWWHNQR